MQPKLLRSLSTTARRRRCTLTMTLASALTFLAFTFVYVDSNCSRNARSFKKTVVSRVQRHALMEDNNGRIALGDVRWYSAPNNRSFYIAARDNVRFEKVNKWSTWDIWPIDEAALRKIRTLSRALLPRFGMGKDEIRPDSTRLHKCVKKSRGCKLDDKNAIRHYQTCAVVGNSGILTGSHCGGEIDAHDYVIRFSVGPTAGYEDDVGTKRNITFLNKDNLLKISKSLRLPSSKNVYAQRLTRMNASTFMFAKGKNKEWNTDIKSLITIARRNNLCFTLRKNTKNLGIIIRGIISQEMPDLAQHLGGVDTTGMMSVFMASTFCHRINLYGFYPFTKDTRGKDIRYHYYDNVKPRRQGSVDNYPTEFMVNKRLHRLGVVNHVIDKCQ
ncbi:ST8SIA4 [Branchiostoma lanceolatum]|uniref:ST8SIA4 protein n=1 Tax=Branchiostoma lanceolatum TaxID=7740 RepID=A0A8J9Z832_BRALA|nr:ST8SIA4 [Branchiostoma lanceolatum]